MLTSLIRKIWINEYQGLPTEDALYVSFEKLSLHTLVCKNNTHASRLPLHSENNNKAQQVEIKFDLFTSMLQSKLQLTTHYLEYKSGYIALQKNLL